MNPLKLFSIILCLFFFSAKSTHAQWVSLSSNTIEAFNDLFFVTPDTGFVVGESEILYKTTNGGDSWESIYFNTSKPLGAIYFSSKNIGYVNGFKTNDMGASWVPLNVGGAGTTSLYFINDSIGFSLFGATGSTYWKTKDGGVSWEEKLTPSFAVLEKFEFTSPEVGYLVGWYSGAIYKTTDQGETWALIDPMNAFSINFPTQNTGFAVGWYGVIQKTTNAGSTWQLLNTGLSTDIRLHDINCTDKNICYAVGDSGVILKTTNGGNDWERQYSGTTADLKSIFFTSADTGFVVGANGTILKTTNGGGLTRIPPIGGTQPEVSVFPNPASTVLNMECSNCSKSPLLVRIFDSLGRELAIFPLYDDKNVFHISAFADGIYHYALLTEHATIKCGSFVKQKQP